MSHQYWTSNLASSTGTFNISGVDGATVTIHRSIVEEAHTDNGTEIMMKVSKQINPRLYFRFVKHKMSKMRQEALKARMVKIQALMKNFKEMGQDAPYETLMKELYVATKQAEIIATGFDKVVKKADMEKFMYRVNYDNKIVKYDELSKFPRPIPEKNRKDIKRATKLSIFDKLTILYLDYTNEVHKTTKEKIIEKDPIVFGSINEDSDNLFFITDWQDDVCDLTLSKLVDEMKIENPKYQITTEEDLDAEFVARVKAEYEEKNKRLSETKRDNFRELAKDEEISKLKRDMEEKEKALINQQKNNSLWSKIKRFFGIK